MLCLFVFWEGMHVAAFFVDVRGKVKRFPSPTRQQDSTTPVDTRARFNAVEGALPRCGTVLPLSRLVRPVEALRID